MALLHDLRCTPCGWVEESVLCRREPGGKALLPPCPRCGSDRNWVPAAITVPATTRREVAPELKNHYRPGPGGFAQKYSKEREADHHEQRRMGRPGNQEEFADVIPLTDAEEADYQAKEKLK
jgi:hypothetical protein